MEYLIDLDSLKDTMRFLLPILFLSQAIYLEAFLKEKTIFPFSNELIDVVIPSIEKDLPTLNLCIAGIKKNGRNIRRIIVVSKKRLTDKAEWYSEENFPFSFQDINKYLAKKNFKTKVKKSQNNSRTGWYYQQLLKLYAPLVIPEISANVLILDSDTIFLNPVSFLNESYAGQYNTGIEYHLPYFEHATLLIPGFYKIFPTFSGVCHHMLFQRPVIEDLFNTVESYHAKPFWQSFCELVQTEHLLYSGASEYEIYFNYVFSRTNQVSIRPLSWLNINQINRIPFYKSKGLHYVSIHSYDRAE